MGATLHGGPRAGATNARRSAGSRTATLGSDGAGAMLTRCGRARRCPRGGVRVPRRRATDEIRLSNSSWPGPVTRASGAAALARTSH